MSIDDFYEKFIVHPKNEDIVYDSISKEAYLINHIYEDFIYFYKLTAKELFEIAQEDLLNNR